VDKLRTTMRTKAKGFSPPLPYDQGGSSAASIELWTEAQAAQQHRFDGGYIKADISGIWGTK
jgi:hypothetical protein